MSSSDFFKEIDDRLVDLDRSEKEKERRDQEQEVTIREFVKEVVPHLGEYKEQLGERGVRVEFDHGDTHLSFKMYYADGGYHGFRLTRDEKRYKLQGLFTDERRKSYTAEGGGAWAVEQRWSWPEMKKYLEDEIRNFFAYSSRHGGFKRR
jgi:hypothetical protein